METSLRFFFGCDTPSIVELLRTEIVHPLLDAPRIAVRGKISATDPLAGTFQWTAGVRALCELVLKSALAPQARLEGERGSPAYSLDAAINKQTAWLLDMFGLDSSGRPLVFRFLKRSNTQGKRPEPIRLFLNDRMFPRDAIAIYLGERKLCSPAEIEALHSLLQGRAKSESLACLNTAPEQVISHPVTHLSRLPHSGSLLLGREHELTWLNSNLADHQVRLLEIVALGGLGKTALINHWLTQLLTAATALNVTKVVGYSFYSQGFDTNRECTTDEFFSLGFQWFGGMPTPDLSAWERGELLARQFMQSNSLLVLDGLEPLQCPIAGDFEAGRLRDPALSAFLRTVARGQQGRCVLTSRIAVSDLDEFSGTTLRRMSLASLSAQTGAELLRVLGVEGTERDLLSASEEFRGHALSLTLLGTYLVRAGAGDITRRMELPALSGVATPAKRILASYEHWFQGHPEEELLRMLGLFDRPVEWSAVRTLLCAPAIAGLTEKVGLLPEAEQRLAIANLADAHLVSLGTDGTIDCHPLIREYAAHRLQESFAPSWQAAHQRLYTYYASRVPPDPLSAAALQPLFYAIAHGCKASLHAEVFRILYVQRLRGGTMRPMPIRFPLFESLVSVLAGFFAAGKWDSIVASNLTPAEQVLLAEDAALLLSLARGLASQGSFEASRLLLQLGQQHGDLRAEIMGNFGVWRYPFMQQELPHSLNLAQELLVACKKHPDPSFQALGLSALAMSLTHMGDFCAAKRVAQQGADFFDLLGTKPRIDNTFSCGFSVSCLAYHAVSRWPLNECAEAYREISLAIEYSQQLDDPHAHAISLYFGIYLYFVGGNFVMARALLERLLNTAGSMQGFWRTTAGIYQSFFAALDHPDRISQCIQELQHGIRDFELFGARLGSTFWLALLAQCLCLAQRFQEGMETLTQALERAESAGELYFIPELFRLRALVKSELNCSSDEIEREVSLGLQFARRFKAGRYELNLEDAAKLIANRERREEIRLHVAS